MKKPMSTFQFLEENMKKAVAEKVAVERKAGFSGSASGEERKKKQQEELMPPLPEEAPPTKQTLRNVSSQKQEKIAPTLPIVQVISPPIPPTKEQCSSSPIVVSWVPPTKQRKRILQCVQPSSSPQDLPQRRKGKEMVKDILQLTNEAPATFLVEQLQAEKLVLEQDKEKLNKEKEEQRTVANLQVEKSAFTNRLQQCEVELATVKKDLNTIRASLKKATTTVTKLNGNLLVSNLLLEEEKEKVCKLEQKLDTAKKSLADCNLEILLLKNEKATQEAQTIQDFLRSRAFQTSAFLALSKHYPFSPQEVGVQDPVNAEALDLSSYRWNQKSDKLVSEDGIVLDHPTTLPNLSELHVDHPWIGPFPTLVSEDEESEDNKSKMVLKDEDEDHREKDG